MIPVRALRTASVALTACALAACGATIVPERAVEDAAPVVVLPPGCVDDAADADGDGLSDTCEMQIATAFAPVLMQSHVRCTAPPSAPRQGIPGGYFHAVQPVHGAVRVLYLPAYYRDCGWRGAACAFTDCSQHAGDSEMIALDVVPRDSGRWIVTRIFLSAHCFGRTGSDCRWYEGEQLDAFAWESAALAAPIVWVSDGRQANYPTRSACNRGHMGLDRCAADADAFRFPVRAERNIGSRNAPIRLPGLPPGCVNGAFVEPGELLVLSPEAQECFWAGERFGGWQGGQDGVTGYARYLELMEL